MRKALIYLLIPLLFSISSPGYTKMKEDKEIPPFIIKAALFLARAFVTFRFTSIMAPIETESSANKGDPLAFLNGVAKSEEEALSALGDPSLVKPKGVLSLRTKGFFEKRFEFEFKGRFLGTVTSVQIYCKKRIGEDKVGVTLQTCDEEEDWKRLIGPVKGDFDMADEGNECEWTDYGSMLLAFELGRAYVKVRSEEYPDGVIMGNLENIGL